MSITLSTSTVSTDWHRPAWWGFAVILLAFGGFGGWAAIAEIEGSIAAQGSVSVETNSKSVQHFEGGIVAGIYVKEGQAVQQNQVLMRLSDVQAKATFDTYNNQLLPARVLEARLLAERDGAETVTFPDDIIAQGDSPVVKKVMDDQMRQFSDRRNSLSSQLSIFDARKDGLRSELEGLSIEQTSLTKQVGYISQELVGLHQLLAKQLVPLDRVLSLERERTRLQGNIGRALTDQARARNAIGETTLQQQQVRQKFQEETSSAITEIRQKVSDLAERRRSAHDIMERVEIRAPVSGTVQDLRVSGLNQVIRPGEVLMSIVPESEQLVVRAHFAPTDISHVIAGQPAEVRFPAFHSRSIPVILGHLASVSHDRLVDDMTHQPYYLGMVAVTKLEIPEDLRLRLRAGMPAEVIVSSGSRTMLSYLISPLTEAWRKSFTEP